MTELEALSDHFIVGMYEAIRKEVIADAFSGTGFADLPARQRAEELRLEIDRRGLFCVEIDWPEHLKEAGGDTCEPTAGHRKMTSN